MSPLVFLDCETLGLGINDPIWEIAAIRRESDGTENRYHFHVSDAEGRRLTPPGGFPDRFRADFDARSGQVPPLPPCTLRPLLRNLFSDRSHIVGAVPNFDTERIEHQLGVSGWHHHLIDVEALAVGWLRGRGRPMPDLPWDSDTMSRMVGVDPDRFDRHTAMGDALWTQAIYDRIVYDLAVGGER